MKTDIPRCRVRLVPIALALSLVAPFTSASDSFSLSSFQASSQLLVKIEPVSSNVSGINNHRQVTVSEGGQLRVKERKSKLYLALLMAFKNR